MQLLSPWLLLVLGLLTVAAPVATYLSWNRIPGRRPVRVAARVGLLATSQVAAVLLMAAAANDYGDFYGSWAELFGVNGGQVGPITAVTGGRGASGAVGRMPAELVDLGQWQAVPRRDLAKRGEVLHVRLGGRTGLSEDAYVWLPPQYFQPAYAHRDFAAAEIFTGFPGNARALPGKLRYQDVLARQVAGRRTEPFVLVMLRPSVTYPRDTECVNVPNGPQAESFFAHDVVTDITSYFRVRRGGWGAMGDSTGGWCATLLAFHHPATFRAAVSMSGYFHPLRDFTTGDLFAGSSSLRDQSDPEWLLRHRPAPPIALLATGGRDERGPYGYADLAQLRRLAKAPLALATLTLPGSAHNFRAWRAQLPDDLAWLGQHLR
jgi:hypothetical protein